MKMLLPLGCMENHLSLSGVHIMNIVIDITVTAARVHPIVTATIVITPNRRTALIMTTLTCRHRCMASMATVRGDQAEIGRGLGLTPRFHLSTVNQIVWIERIYTQTHWVEATLVGARDSALTDLMDMVLRTQLLGLAGDRAMEEEG